MLMYGRNQHDTVKQFLLSLKKIIFSVLIKKKKKKGNVENQQIY